MRLRKRAEQSTLWQEVRPVSPPAWQDDGREVLTCDGSGLIDIDIPETPQGNAALLALQGITQQEALAALTLARQ